MHTTRYYGLKVWCLMALTIAQSLLLKYTTAQTTTERETLQDFFELCNGEFWDQKVGWLDPTASTCMWFGITCNTDGSVTKVELADNNVQCMVPPSLFDLKQLQVLDVQSNPGVGLDFRMLDATKTQNVQSLFLSDTSLSSLEGLELGFAPTSLTTFVASGNNMLGPFPSQQLLSFEKLRHLDISNNLYTGDIPTELATSLPNLDILSLAHNVLGGRIPDNFATLTQLTALFLNDNLLSGDIPAGLQQLVQLSTLFLNDQVDLDEAGGLTGSLPAFDSSPSLLLYNVAHNKLSGTVPTNLLQLVPPEFSELIMVDLRHNVLTGTVPGTLARYPSLRFFAQQNQISDIDMDLCAEGDWLFGDVQKFGCNGILCPPQTFNSYGRQVFVEQPCQPCESGGAVAPFYGSTACLEVERSRPMMGQDPERDVATTTWLKFLRGGTLDPPQKANQMTSSSATSVLRQGLSTGIRVLLMGWFVAVLGTTW